MNMKKITLIVVFSITILITQSCGNRTPIIDGEVPFVVGKIVKYDDSHSEYYAIHYGSGKFLVNTQSYPSIILPSGLYQINDTIHATWLGR